MSTLNRVTATDALDTAKALAGELIGDSVLTWRVGHDLRTGRITVDGQLCNDALSDVADWADVLDPGSGTETEEFDNPNVAGRLSAVGTYDGVPVRIWTAITRTTVSA